MCVICGVGRDFLIFFCLCDVRGVFLCGWWCLRTYVWCVVCMWRTVRAVCCACVYERKTKGSDLSVCIYFYVLPGVMFFVVVGVVEKLCDLFRRALGVHSRNKNS